MTAVGLLRKQGDLGLVRLVEGGEMAFTTCQLTLPLLAIRSSQLIHSKCCLVFSLPLGTSMFSSVSPVCLGYILVCRAVFAACHLLQESLYRPYGKLMHSEFHKGLFKRESGRQGCLASVWPEVQI